LNSSSIDLHSHGFVCSQALTSALTSAIADLIAQRLIGAPYNIAATLRQTFIGFCIRGPVTQFFKFLSLFI
jgi:hypothetical protein